jgi:quinol monooxygenase YgiN
MWRLAAATSSRCIVRDYFVANIAPSSKLTSQQIEGIGFHNSMILRRTFSSANYLCVHVFVSVKPGCEGDFLTASLANARASSQEPGIARFDVIQQEDDPTKFVLVEVYKNDDAPSAHKETKHYLSWRTTVENMMAEPRKAIKYKNIFPATANGWDYGDGVKLE